MDRIDKVLFSVIKKITPTSQEESEIEEMKKKLLQVTDSIIKPLGLSRTLAGSLVRNTWLRDKKEFDIFIEFPETLSKKQLEEQGLTVGKKIVSKLGGKYIIAYAEHPYVRGKIGKFWIDIVPCYKLKSAFHIKSAVDRTPFHNQWLKKHFKPSYIPETRLLKQFLKSLQIYGSDAKTLGLSGYLCELLIVHYKTFKNFLKKSAEWIPGKVIIDLEKHYKGNPVHDFPGQPLIVIDPVDPKRNVAAALSPLNFMKLVFSSKKFLKNPSEDFFFPKFIQPDAKKLRFLFQSRETVLLGLKFSTPQIVEDTLWPQLRRTARRLINLFKENEFIPINHDIYCSEKNTILVFEFEVYKLPKIKKIIGPVIFSKKHSDQFIRKYKNTGKLWIEGERWIAEVPRTIQTPDILLKNFLTGSEKVLKEKGIASYIAKEISKGFQILSSSKLLQFANKDSDFAGFLFNYFERNLL